MKHGNIIMIRRMFDDELTTCQSQFHKVKTQSQAYYWVFSNLNNDRELEQEKCNVPITFAVYIHNSMDLMLQSCPIKFHIHAG